MQIPPEPVYGENWKNAVLQWIRRITEYFKRSRVIPDNRTVFARYTSEGMILSCSVKNGPSSVEAGNARSDYNGYFKTVFNSETGNVEVIDGLDRMPGCCGVTDLTASGGIYGMSSIPVTVFTGEDLDKQENTICLGAYWNKDTGYRVLLFLDGKMPQEMLSAERYVNAAQIASVTRLKYTADGPEFFRIIQIYREDIYYFGRTYLI